MSRYNLLILFSILPVFLFGQMPAKEAFKNGLAERDPIRKLDYFAVAVMQKPDWADAYFQRGLCLLNFTEYKRAENDFTKAIEYQKKYEEAYHYRGMARHYLGKQEAAIADFDSALLFRKKYVEPIYGRGLAKMALGNYVGAIKDFSDVLLLQPDSAYKCYTQRGWAYAQIGVALSASQDFQEAIARKSDYALAYYYRGLSQKSMHPKEALQDFSKAALYDEKNWAVFQEKAHLEQRLKRQNEAIDDYSQVIDLLKDVQTTSEKQAKADAFFYRGLLEEEIRRMKGEDNVYPIVADMDSCLKYDKMQDSAYLMKGWIDYDERRHYDKALVNFNEVLRINPTSADAWHYKIKCLYELKKYQMLMDEVDKSIAMQGNNTEAIVNLNALKGDAAFELKRYATAIQAYDIFLKSKTKNGGVYLQRGLSHMNLGNSEKAIYDFSQAIIYNPYNYLPYLNRAKLYVQQKKYAEAIVDLDKVQQQRGDCTKEVLHLRAAAKKAISDEKGAIADYLAEVKCGFWNNNIEKAETYTNLGFLMNEAEKYEDAVKYLYVASKLDPKNADIYYTRGMAENELGRTSAAKKSLDSLARLKPNLDVEVLKTRAMLSFNQGDYPAAIAGFEQLLKQNPNNVTALYHKALSEKKINNRTAALVDFEKVIDLNPLNMDVYPQLAEIFMDLHDYEKALPNVQKMIASNPASVNGFLYLTKIYISQKNWDKAQESLNNLLVLDESNAQGYASRAGLNMHFLRYSEAQKDIDQALIYNPNCADAHFYQGRLQYDYGKYSDAIASFSQAIQQNTLTEADYFYYRALAYAALSQSTEAIQDLDVVIAIQANNQEAIEKRKIEVLRRK